RDSSIAAGGSWWLVPTQSCGKCPEVQNPCRNASRIAPTLAVRRPCSSPAADAYCAKVAGCGGPLPTWESHNLLSSRPGSLIRLDTIDIDVVREGRFGGILQRWKDWPAPRPLCHFQRMALESK